MTLNLIRRLVKGTPLTAAEHDGNLDKLENAIEASPAGAREWTASTIEQAEAEDGTATTRRAFTAQRVRQAIAAWWTAASTAAGRAMVEAADAAAQRTLLGLGTADSPSFTGLTITGAGPVVIPHIHGSIAGDFYVHVKNTSGGPLAAGTAVYVVGSVGDTDRIEVAACDPTDPAKMPAIGLLQSTLATNGEGDAVVLGELRPFNSGGFQIRDRLYVGAGGALVATPPASGLVQYVGSVARAQAETGTILVGIGAALARVGFTGAYADLSGTPTLGTAAATDSTDYAPAAEGVTNGNSHNHDGGGGAQIAYSSLSGTPTIPAPADAAPQPPGTAAVGSSTDYAREDHVHDLPPVVSTSTAGLRAATSFSTIAYAAQVALDFAALDSQYRTISLAGDLELTTSNLANGRTLVLRLAADATERTFTFPADWVFIGTKPSTIAASKTAVLSLTAFGTANTDVVAAYQVQS